VHSEVPVVALLPYEPNEDIGREIAKEMHDEGGHGHGQRTKRETDREGERENEGERETMKIMKERGINKERVIMKGRERKRENKRMGF
jgi:hypothetical protein